MNEWPEAYPLSWPAGWRRTPFGHRRNSPFQVKMGRARDELLHELMLMGSDHIVLSTDIPLRRDGLPYANYRAPDDPGVAVYFALKGRTNVMACDTFHTIGANMRALGLSVAALRAIDRYGASQIFEQAFDGMRALPAEGHKRDWWVVLAFEEIPPSLADAKKAHRRLISEHHPDQGGDEERARELHEALASARQHFAV